jgi:hypothetical protein
MVNKEIIFRILYIFTAVALVIVICKLLPKFLFNTNLESFSLILILSPLIVGLFIAAISGIFFKQFVFMDIYPESFSGKPAVVAGFVCLFFALFFLIFSYIIGAERVSTHNIQDNRTIKLFRQMQLFV